MKTESKILFVFIIALFSILLLGTTNVFATNTERVEITIEDSKGMSPGYHSPGTGGSFGYIDLNQDYTGYTFVMGTKNNYGEKIETELGTFTYKNEIPEDDVWKVWYEANYLYVCSVDSAKFKAVADKYYDNSTNKIEFTVDVDIESVNSINFEMSAYKTLFKPNANLKVDDTDIVVNGKVIRNGIQTEDYTYYASYDAVTNRLDLCNVTGKENTYTVSYSNMGETFKITTDSCSANISSENTKTGVKFDCTNTSLPETVELVVDSVTTGETYDTVTTTLKDEVEKFYVYDISLMSANTVIQPDSKIKIYIPIPEGYDTSKLVVYRVAENGEKTKYDVTVNGKYATFETDHFSTYVLAEKQVETETVTPPVEETPKAEETPKVETSKGQKDETPKTGTVETIYFILPVMVISALGIVLFKKK